MLGAAVRSAAASPCFNVDVETELRGNDHFVADGLECLAYQLFVGERTVSFSSVEKGDAKIMSGANQLDHLPLVCWRPIGRTHAHATEANSRDLKPTVSENSSDYFFSLYCSRCFAALELLPLPSVDAMSY